MDRLLLVSLLMGVESSSGAADLEATVTWPGAEVAARLDHCRHVDGLPVLVSELLPLAVLQTA